MYAQHPGMPTSPWPYPYPPYPHHAFMHGYPSMFTGITQTAFPAPATPMTPAAASPSVASAATPVGTPAAGASPVTPTACTTKPPGVSELEFEAAVAAAAPVVVPKPQVVAAPARVPIAPIAPGMVLAPLPAATAASTAASRASRGASRVVILAKTDQNPRRAAVVEHNTNTLQSYELEGGQEYAAGHLYQMNVTGNTIVAARALATYPAFVLDILRESRLQEVEGPDFASYAVVNAVGELVRTARNQYDLKVHTVTLPVLAADGAWAPARRGLTVWRNATQVDLRVGEVIIILGANMRTYQGSTTLQLVGGGTMLRGPAFEQAREVERWYRALPVADAGFDDLPAGAQLA